MLVFDEKKPYFCDRTMDINMPQSIEKKIFGKIQKRGRGNIFSSSDFASYGEPKSVSKALERLVSSGKLIRLYRGLYLYPKTDKELGLGILYPTFDEIARILAKRDKARIVPAGDYVLNRLGLSMQVPMNVVYLTDGTGRKVEIADGRGITFKHAALKNFFFSNELAQLVTVALKEIGKDNVTAEQINAIQELVRKEEREKLAADMKLMPGWIRSIVLKAYEQVL